MKPCCSFWLVSSTLRARGNSSVCTYSVVNGHMKALRTEKTGESAPFYLGVVGAIGSVGRLLGPLIMGSMFDLGGAVPAILLAIVMSVVSVILCLIHASFLRKESRLAALV
ncbi:hypothetical protein [Brevibacillus sp. H7]|uniref:hypothetical protein n=1 Tax=Brevibacillus sp. H7 TaxID=3349138 RepID=UPI0038306351